MPQGLVMTPGSPRPVAWGPLVGAMVIGAALTGIVAWRLNLQSLDERIREKRSTVKKLVLSGNIPPNQDVMDYLNARQAQLEQHYQHWLQVVSIPPMAEAAKADPQLYFQEQFHEVQRTLERLATARTMPVPEQLGFPKEIPPSDTVPRLLAQLSLIQEVAMLIIDQGATTLTSLRVQDPETVSGGEGEGPFLVQLPVRIRLTSSLAQLMKILGAIERAEPLIDVREIRILGGLAEPSLDVELLLARHVVVEATIEEPAPAVTNKRGATARKPARSKSKVETDASQERE